MKLTTDKVLSNLQLIKNKLYIEPAEYTATIDAASAAVKQNVDYTSAIENIKKFINSGNRGNADYFIVDQIESAIMGLEKGQ